MAYPVSEKAGLGNYLEDYNGRGPKDMLSAGLKQAAVLREMLQNAVPTSFFNNNFERRLSSPEEQDPRTKHKTEEDVRLDFLLRMQKTMSETFDNPTYVNPHGMTCYDYKSIPDNKKKKLEKFKMKIRRENYIYLRVHPELEAIMAVFIQRILKSQPKDPIKFTAEFFAQKRVSQDELGVLVEEEKEKIKRFHHVPHGPDSYFPSAGKGFNEVNEVKTLSVGILAEKFEFTPPPSPPKVEVGPKKKFYCGCKDKSRRATSHVPRLSPMSNPEMEGEGGDEEEEEEEEEEEVNIETNYFPLEEDESQAEEGGYDGDDSNEEEFTDDGEANVTPPASPKIE